MLRVGFLMDLLNTFIENSLYFLLSPKLFVLINRVYYYFQTLQRISDLIRLSMIAHLLSKIRWKIIEMPYRCIVFLDLEQEIAIL